jgi:hypothetical protein
MDFDGDSAQAYTKPFPGETPVESILAGHIAKRALIVGPVIVAAAWIISGQVAAISAAAGVIIVALNFLLSGWLLSRAATVSMQTYHAVALFGFFLRMGFIALSMFAVAWIFEVDRRAMGLAAIIAFMALLMLETSAMLRGARKELEWS